jgi:hypothetical protein
VSPLASRPQQGLGAANKFVDTINSSSQTVVHQLKQLYKHYEERSDREGMGRVLDQISLLVSAQQKIFAAQSNLGSSVPATSSATSSGGTGSFESLPSSQLQPVPKSATVAVLGNKVGLQQQQQHQQQSQQQAHQILSQLVGKNNQSGWQGAKFPRAEGSGSSSMLAGGTLASTGTAMPEQRTVPPTLPSYSEAGSLNSSGSGGGTVPPSLGSSRVNNAVMNTPPSLLGHVSASSTNTPSEQLNNSKSSAL